MAEQTVELAPSESKQVSFEAIPHEAKTYQVSVNGLTGSFTAIAPAPPGGEILEITWYDGANWRPITDPMPEMTELHHRWKVRNTGTSRYYFNIGWYVTGYAEGWHYTNYPIELNPGEEGYIEGPFGSGAAKPPFSFTFYLFGNDTPLTGYQGKEPRESCDSITVTITVV